MNGSFSVGNPTLVKYIGMGCQLTKHSIYDTLHKWKSANWVTLEGMNYRTHQPVKLSLTGSWYSEKKRKLGVGWFYWDKWRELYIKYA